jgi:hypothetical protein
MRWCGSSSCADAGGMMRRSRGLVDADPSYEKIVRNVHHPVLQRRRHGVALQGRQTRNPERQPRGCDRRQRRTGRNRICHRLDSGRLGPATGERKPHPLETHPDNGRRRLARRYRIGALRLPWHLPQTTPFQHKVSSHTGDYIAALRRQPGPSRFRLREKCPAVSISAKAS